jgi:2-polyprenyl-3-methyl-5-hydroxy-6-metoxy-1,4-benzoquinol methylase
LLAEYYARRAREYERIYERDDPVRQGELRDIAAAMRRAISDRHVLEIACGTGYWTAVIAEAAASVVATDISAEMLAVARDKALQAGTVEFRVGDAFRLEEIRGRFDAAVAMFWLSHVPRDQMSAFLEQLHGRLPGDAVVFLADNVFVPGVGGELVARPGCTDTFKHRTLKNGSQYEIVKNYYDADELQVLLQPWARDLRIDVGTCYWQAVYHRV